MMRSESGGANGRWLVAWLLLVAGADALSQGPSFSCAGVEPQSIEALVCSDDGLAGQDRELAAVYAAALAKAGNEHPPVLRAEQRGWIKGRDDCWKSEDARVCVAASYRQRIAELQAQYRLVEYRGPVVFSCHGADGGGEIVATYFDTDPPTLIAERGDQVSLMFLQRSGSGSRYEGRNELLWEHQGEARVQWGYGAREMHCQRQ